MMLKMLKAGNGDAIVITTNENKEEDTCNIIIDGGPSSAYKKLKSTFKSLNLQQIDAMFLTHADDDHINGLLKFIANEENLNIQCVYLNSPKGLEQRYKQKIEERVKVETSDRNDTYYQAIDLENYLDQKCIPIKNIVCSEDDEIIVRDIKFEIISPTDKELRELCYDWKIETYEDRDHAGRVCDYDKSIKELCKQKENTKNSKVNASSIAMIMTYKDNKVLLLGDAQPEVVQGELEKRKYFKENRLKVLYMKISHHGSKHNTTEGLLDVIDCNNFLISTNGTRHGHPDKEALSRIANEISKRGQITNFYFNYEHNNIFTEQEKKDYKINCVIQQEFTL